MGGAHLHTFPCITTQTSMAYQLIIRSNNDGKSSRLVARVMTEALRRALGALNSCQLAEGPAEAMASDPIELDAGLRSGDFDQDDFGRFCAWKGLPMDEGNAMSAAQFIDARWGVKLTTVTLPQEVELVKAAYAELIAFAKVNRLMINDPQLGRVIDLEAAGEMPPKWNG